MTIFAASTGIGSKAIYFLFIWLLSAAGGAWIADRKGYGERVGLTFGLVLTAVGFLIVLMLPARPGSTWKLEGPRPGRSRSAGDAAGQGSAPAPSGGAGPASPPAPAEGAEERIPPAHGS